MKNTFNEFIDDKTSRLAAALAFYTTFSVAPLLVMAIAAVSLVFGTSAVEGHLKHELLGLLGESSAEQIEVMIAGISKDQHAGIVSSSLGAIALLFGATGVFVELKDSMNTIWGVEAKPGVGLWGVFYDRILSFAMVLSTAFLLLVSMILSSVLSGLSHLIPTSLLSTSTIDFAASTIVITLLFMLIFKYLPDAEVLWKDVWIGALVTSLLFTVGKYLLALYFGHTAFASAYGAAGSVIVFLLWTYYSAWILFFGAEFTQVYAQMCGRQIVPSANAQMRDCGGAMREDAIK